MSPNYKLHATPNGTTCVIWGGKLNQFCMVFVDFSCRKFDFLSKVLHLKFPFGKAGKCRWCWITGFWYALSWRTDGPWRMVGFFSCCMWESFSASSHISFPRIWKKWWDNPWCWNDLKLASVAKLETVIEYAVHIFFIKVWLEMTKVEDIWKMFLSFTKCNWPWVWSIVHPQMWSHLRLLLAGCLKVPPMKSSFDKHSPTNIVVNSVLCEMTKVKAKVYIFYICEIAQLFTPDDTNHLGMLLTSL